MALAKENMKRTLVATLACAAVLGGCSPVSTRWHTEPVTDSSVSMNGSYQNALDSLVVKSHEWKVTAVDTKRNQCKWGFRVVLQCKDHPDYQDSTNYPGSRAIMPIESIEYTLYDKDNFHLTTLILQSKNLGLYFRDTQTFQQTSKDNLDVLKRAVHGCLNVKAGYYWQKGMGIIMVKGP